MLNLTSNLEIVKENKKHFICIGMAKIFKKSYNTLWEVVVRINWYTTLENNLVLFGKVESKYTIGFDNSK